MKPTLSSATCPRCKGAATLRKIVYGLPGDDFDFEKYAVGGCVMSDDGPQIACRVCDWRGKYSELKESANG